MPAENFLNLLSAVFLTCAGSLWTDKLYQTSAELTFPEEVSGRSRFRKPILFCALVTFFNMTDDLWISAAIFLLVLMTITDLEQYMLFDAMTIPLAIIGALYAWQMNLNFLDHAVAAIIGGGIFLLLTILSKGALGGGDMKLIFGLGMWLGTEKLSDVILTGSIFGGVVALTMILLKKKRRDSYLAYGPYFTLSAIYFLLAG